MPTEQDADLAALFFQRAFEAQMRGDLHAAVDLYKRSLSAYRTAEAHTFLGWTYSFQGKLPAAIAECKRAIEIDPEFGNPYNDIGAYLLELGRPDEAIPWLERATRAPRYDAPHYPRFNLGRAFVAKEMYTRAIAEFQEALRLRPDYQPARDVIAAVKRKIN